MTALMERMVAAMAKLPDEQQNSFASLILEELTGEKLWASSQPDGNESLASLLAEARAEYRQGKTKPMSKERVIADDQELP